MKPSATDPNTELAKERQLSETGRDLFRQFSTGGTILLPGPTGAVPLLNLPYPEADKAAELDIHLADLRQANAGLTFLNRLIDREELQNLPDSERDALAITILEGIVVAYCRCFDGNGKQGHQLKADVILAGKPKGLSAHQHIWDLRNKHYAHDLNPFRDSVVGLGLYPDGTFEIRAVGFPMSPDRNVIRNIGRLLRDTINYCQAEFYALLAILKQQVEKLAPSELAVLQPVQRSVPSVKEIASKRRRTRV